VIVKTKGKPIASSVQKALSRLESVHRLQTRVQA
jgi:hypothetical protein